MIYDIALIYEFYVCFYRKETSIRVLTTEKTEEGTKGPELGALLISLGASSLREGFFSRRSNLSSMESGDYFFNRKERKGKGVYFNHRETEEGTKGTELGALLISLGASSLREGFFSRPSNLFSMELGEYFLTAKSAKGQGKCFNHRENGERHRGHGVG